MVIYITIVIYSNIYSNIYIYIYIYIYITILYIERERVEVLQKGY